ncbi:MAG: phenylalanine--tRNA ligase subunit alpha, partial [Alphaproteobacteria bacterium]|nr:phenylalanine--tRNA ligase subunit alpha [Alphaproteobacteria bacterium]
MEDLDSVRREILASIDAAGSGEALEQVRVAALGRKGQITTLMKGLGGLDPEARKTMGAGLNRLKDEIAEALEAAGARLDSAALTARLASERIDVTLPVRAETEGRLHPISQTIDELTAIFGEMGFSVAEGPHIEDDFHNFTALNIPPEHPARQELDTFYLPEKLDGSRRVLRTHTSPVQIRTMLRDKPPIRIIVPGRTFRSDH